MAKGHRVVALQRRRPTSGTREPHWCPERKEFDLELAATLAKITRAEAIAALDEARRRHIIWARTQDTRCAFIHDKLRQTLLERLPH